MGDLLGFMLLALGLVFGVPALIAINLYGRTRRLREDVEDLRARLWTLETITARAPVAEQPLPSPAVPHVPPPVVRPVPPTVVPDRAGFPARR